MSANGERLKRIDIAACSGGPHEMRAVRRARLLALLTAALPPGTVRYGLDVTDVASNPCGAVADVAGSGPLRCRAVVGADGARSALARQLGLADAEYAGYTAYRGVATFTGGAPPAGMFGTDARSGSAFGQIVYGSGVRAGLLPLGGGDVYWFTTQNDAEVRVGKWVGCEGGLGGMTRGWEGGWREGPVRAPAPPAPTVTAPPPPPPPNALANSTQSTLGGPPKSSEACRADALRLVAGWALPGVAAAIAATPCDTITRSRIGDRWLSPGVAYGAGLLTLVGDAAHPMTPNLAQGGCVGLEDALAVARAFAGSDGSPAGDAACLRDVEAERAARARSVTAKSWAIGALGQIDWPPVRRGVGWG